MTLPPDEPLYHLALRADWSSARARGGPYDTSTIGASLEEVGFIHLSFAGQVDATARRFYVGREDVVLLRIDPARLLDPVRVEPAEGDDGFPHLYGALPLDAVVSAVPLQLGDDGVPDTRSVLRT